VAVAALVSWLVALAVGLPLAWKWQLGIVRVFAWLTVLSVLTNALAAVIADAVGASAWLAAGFALLATALISVAAVAYRFFRDPERVSPADPLAIISPADGTVLYVRRTVAGELPVAEKKGRRFQLTELTRTSLASADAVVVGVGLSLLDVHVNRAPISGRLALARSFAGSFGSLRRPEMVFANERATMVFEQEDRQVAIVMIASRLVRRIVTYVNEGATVAAGQRIGMIKFGSQVDVVIPLVEPVDICVEPGRNVVAGETVIARFAGSPHPRPGSGPAARERSKP
jgi:phosphatidylserine decarboxylase